MGCRDSGAAQQRVVESRWLIWDLQIVEIQVVKIEQVVMMEKVKMLLDYLDTILQEVCLTASH